MNYTVKSVRPISGDEIQRNYNIELDNAQDETYTEPLQGDVCRLELEIVIDEVPIFLTFFCGALSGVQMEHSLFNYDALEANPGILLSDLRTNLKLDYTKMINHNRYKTIVDAAKHYLESQNLAVHSIVGADTDLVIVMSDEVHFNLSYSDIEYYASMDTSY